MFHLVNSRSPEKWTEVCLTSPGSSAIVYHLPEELGEVLGFKTMHGRIVIMTTSNIPMIVRRSDGMEDAIIHVRKVAS
jgi:hypothetical protein